MAFINITDALAQQADGAAVMASPAQRKLEADDFSTMDTNGVTEGAGGSGNLNYLLLQAWQTQDQHMSADGTYLSAADLVDTTIAQGDGLLGGIASPLSEGIQSTGGVSISANPLAGSESITAAGSTSGAGVTITPSQGIELSPVGIGIDNGPSAVSDVGIYSASNSTTNTTTIINPPPGTPGTPDNPPHGGDGGPLIDVHVDAGANDTLSPVTDAVSDTVTTATDLVHNTVTDVLNGDISNLPGNVTDAVADVVDNVSSTVTAVTDTVQNAVSDVAGVLDTPLTLSNPLAIVGALNDVSLVQDLLGNNTLGVGADLRGLLSINLDLTSVADGGLLPDLGAALNIQFGDVVQGLVPDNIPLVSSLIDNGLDVQQSVDGLTQSLLGTDLDSVLPMLQSAAADLGSSLDGILDNTPLAPVVDQVENVVNTLTGDLAGQVEGLSTDVLSGVTDNLGGVLENVASGLGDAGDQLAQALDPVDGLLGGALADTPLGDVTQNLQDALGGLLGGGGSDDTDLNIAAGDTALYVPLDAVEGILGDIDLNLDVTSGGTPDVHIGLLGDALSDPSGSVDDILNNALSDPLAPIADALGGLGDTGGLGDVLGGIVSDPLAAIADTLSDPLAPVTDALGGLGDAGGLADVVDNIVSDPVAAVTDTLDTLGGLGDTGGLGDVTDTVNNILGGLLPDPTPTDPGDTDISLGLGDGLAGLDTPLDLTVGLDPLENLVGDVDVGGQLGDVANDLVDSSLNIDALAPVTDAIDSTINTVTDQLDNITDPLLGQVDDGLSAITAPLLDQVSDVLGGGLLGAGDTDTGDSDLSVSTDVLGLPVDVDVNLDAVENLTGDIDINLPILDSNGGDAELQVGDIDLSPLADTVADLANTVTDSMGDLLPPLDGGTDPMDLVGDALGSVVDVLPTPTDTVDTVVGGLLGGGHHSGGLFGGW